MTDRRSNERRWRNARFYLVERRKGRGRMYGSIVVALALWACLLASPWL